MDITSILQMHQELSLTAVFLLMFVLDLSFPCVFATGYAHWPAPCWELSYLPIYGPMKSSFSEGCIIPLRWPPL